MDRKKEIKYLDWDSKLFGYKVGTISINSDLAANNLDYLIEEGKNLGYKLIYLKTNNEILKLKEKSTSFKILLADKKITYSQQVKRSSTLKIPPHIKEYNKPFPTEELVSLALQSGVYSRFAIDVNFKNQEYEKLYTIWMEKSTTKEIAREVWVNVNEQDIITGFITLGIKNDMADIGLLAVETTERGKNIGKNLIQTAYARTIQWGINKIQVVTQQDNTKACHFYEKTSFTFENIEYIYHIWI